MKAQPTIGGNCNFTVCIPSVPETRILLQYRWVPDAEVTVRPNSRDPIKETNTRSGIGYVTTGFGQFLWRQRCSTASAELTRFSESICVNILVYECLCVHRFYLQHKILKHLQLIVVSVD